MELLDPLIRDLHNVTATGNLPDHPMPQFFIEFDKDENENSEESIEVIDLDRSGKYVLAGVVECSRNLSNFHLPLTLTVNQLESTERILTTALMSSDLASVMAEGSSEDEPGTYYTLSEVLDLQSDIRLRLENAGLLLPITETDLRDEKRVHGRHWPYGRGVYVASAGDLAAWINVQDHLRVTCCTSESKPGQIGKAYVRLARVMNILDKKLSYKRDTKFGLLGARPAAIGNTLRFDIIVKFPGLSKEPDNLRHLCVVRGLRYHPTFRKDTARIGNQQSLSITEFQTLQDFTRAATNIIGLDRELALNSTMRIATLIASIFKRRRRSTSRAVKV